jgi:hypothetical protein
MACHCPSSQVRLFLDILELYSDRWWHVQPEGSGLLHEDGTPSLIGLKENFLVMALFVFHMHFSVKRGSIIAYYNKRCYTKFWYSRAF